MRSAVRAAASTDLCDGQRQFYHAGDASRLRAPSRRGALVHDLRGASSESAAPRAARLACRDAADRRAGARPARARERHTLERSFGQPAARVAAAGPGPFLPRAPDADPPGGLLLPGNGRAGRPAAAARVRAALAPQAAGAAARDPPHAPRGELRPRVLPRRAQEEDARGNRARPRRIPPGVLSPASSEPAQPALAEGPRLVRARRVAAAQTAGQGLPDLDFFAERVKSAA